MRQSLSEYDDRDDGFSLVGEHRQEEAAAASPRDWRLPKFLLTGSAMAIFAGGLWFAYVQGTHHVSPNTTVQSDGVPLLKADGQANKVKPEQPGGMTVPNQNVSLYNDKPGAGSVEKLLPPAEKPMPRPVAPIMPPAPSLAPAAATPEPIAPPADTPPAPGKAAPKPAAVAKAPTVEKAPLPPKTAVTTSAKTEPAPAAAKAGPILVRVGSVRSPEAARDEWARLKRDNSDILGNVKANAVRADLGDKGIYYRIEAGPFNDAAAAERLCSEMKRRSLGCILAR
jgi:hypothetical protein